MNLEYLHPIFVHFPVALTLAGTALLLWGALKKAPRVTRGGLMVLVLAGVLAVPTYITGQVARSVLEDSAGFAHAEAVADRHEDLGLYSLGLLISLGVLSALALRRDEPEEDPRWGLAALALAASLLLVATAFYGGRLVFEHGVGVRVQAGK